VRRTKLVWLATSCWGCRSLVWHSYIEQRRGTRKYVDLGEVEREDERTVLTERCTKGQGDKIYEYRAGQYDPDGLWC